MSLYSPSGAPSSTYLSFEYARYPGKVVTKPRILEAVWGTDKDPLTNVVEVYVGRLRTKLSPNGEADLIRTVRGRGYRMSAPKAGA